MKKYIKKYRASHFLNKFRLLQAFGSVFSVAGNYFHFEYENENFISDAELLQNDWNIVGKDMQLAAKNYSFNNQTFAPNSRINVP